MTSRTDERRKTRASKGRGIWNWRTILGLCAKLAVAGTVLWLMLWALFGDSIAYLGYLNALGFLFMISSGVSGLLLLLLRKWLWGGAGAAIAVLLFAVGSGLTLGDGRADAADSMRVVSASLRGLNDDMESAAVRLAGYDPDIIAVQEVRDIGHLKTALEKHSGKKWYQISDGQYGVLATLPLALSSQRSKNWSAVDIGTGQKRLILWNVHAPKSFARPIENSTYYVDMLDAIRDQRPDMVLGDFNASPWNYGFQLIAGEMDEAHQQAGFGPGNSFPARGRRSGFFGAFSRIDHIFVKTEHKVLNAFTGQASSGADHHPVVADIDFTGRLYPPNLLF